jgi:hypothetical protein
MAALARASDDVTEQYAEAMNEAIDAARQAEEKCARMQACLAAFYQPRPAGSTPEHIVDGRAYLCQCVSRRSGVSWQVRIAELPHPEIQDMAYMTEPGSTPSFHESVLFNDFPNNGENTYMCEDLIEFDDFPPVGCQHEHMSRAMIEGHQQSVILIE